MTQNKRALITGLTGFTGQYVAAELIAAGFDIYGCGKKPASTLPEYAKQYAQVDLLDSSGLAAFIAQTRPHVVVHLAGMASVETKNFDGLYQTNILGTRHLLEAISLEASSTIECVLLASSANVYGNSEKNAALDESDLPNPANDYAVSKLAMEYMAKCWMDRLPIIITRPFNYSGVGQPTNVLIPKIVQHFQQGKKQIELGNLDISRDFSDVRAVANAYRRLIQSQIQNKIKGEIINTCSGNQYSLREIISLMEDIAGYSIEVISNPAFRRANEVKSLWGSANKLKSIIGEWSSPAIKETLEWMYRGQPVSLVLT